MLLPHTTKIERKVKVAGKGLSSEWVDVVASARCLVTPASRQSQLRERFTVGKDYDVYFNTGTDVKEGDRLTTSTGKSLLVSGVAYYDDIPRMAHIATTCSTTGNN